MKVSMFLCEIVSLSILISMMPTRNLPKVNAKIKKSLWAITSNWIDSGKDIKALYQWCQLEMNKTDKNREDETMKVSILLCEISSLSFFISVMLTQIFQKSTKNTKMKKLAVGSYYKLDWEWKREKSVISVREKIN